MCLRVINTLCLSNHLDFDFDHLSNHQPKAARLASIIRLFTLNHDFMQTASSMCRILSYEVSAKSNVCLTDLAACVRR